MKEIQETKYTDILVWTLLTSTALVIWLVGITVYIIVEVKDKVYKIIKKHEQQRIPKTISESKKE